MSVSIVPRSGIIAPTALHSGHAIVRYGHSDVGFMFACVVGSRW